MAYTRQGRMVVAWTALPPPGTLSESPPDGEYDIAVIAQVTARAHQSGRRLTDALIEMIAEAQGASPHETDVAKSLLESPIRYSRKSGVYEAKPEWACAMIAAKVPAVVVEQTKG